MRKRRVRTPDEVAKQKKHPRVQISAIVEGEPLEYLRKEAERLDLALSDLVNEAIKSYVDQLRDPETGEL